MSYYRSLGYFSCKFPITAHLVPSITSPITTDLTTSAAKAGLMNSTASPVAAPQTIVPALPPLQLAQHHSSCVLNTSSLPLLFGTVSTLFIFPDRIPSSSYFSLHNCLICFTSAYHWCTISTLFDLGCLKLLMIGGDSTDSNCYYLACTLYCQTPASRSFGFKLHNADLKDSYVGCRLSHFVC